MNISSGVGTVSRIYIEGAQALDPITVLMEDMQPGVGRITIICWGEVWTAFWGGMAGDCVGDFLLRNDDEYITKNLWNGKKHNRQQTAYLLRIVAAVRVALGQAEGQADA